MVAHRKIERIDSSSIYDLLVALFVATLIISNIASVKLASIGSVVFDAGTLLFPIAYIVGDVITEVYGFRRLRRILSIAVGMLLLSVMTFWVVGLLPAADGWLNQSSYELILGVVWRIVLASVVAIFVGELINSYVLAKMKYHNKGKFLWQRLIGSSLAGSLIDTVIFSVIAFVGTVSLSVLINLILSVYAIKILVEIIVSPLTIKIINNIKNKEQTDVYENPMIFS